MKKADRSGASQGDTMRAEYDFSQGVRGATAVRYQQGVNLVLVDPEVRDVFPDSAAVNRVLRALAPVLREQRGRKRASSGAKRSESHPTGSS